MTFGVFADQTQPPSPEDILTSLVPMQPLWSRLVAFFARNNDIPLGKEKVAQVLDALLGAHAGGQLRALRRSCMMAAGCSSSYSLKPI